MCGGDVMRRRGGAKSYERRKLDGEGKKRGKKMKVDAGKRRGGKRDEGIT